MCQTFEGERGKIVETHFFYLQKAIQTAGSAVQEGLSNPGRRPVCAVCRKSMGGGFLEQIKVRLMEELQTPVAFTIPLFGGIPVTLSVVVSWLVMGALILAAAAGDPAIEAP